MLIKPTNFLHPYLKISLNYYLQTTSSKTYYQTLELPEGSTFKQIKAQYLSKAKIHHPDINPSHYNIYTQIQEAYRILSNIQSRKKYDLSLGIKQSKWQIQILRNHDYKFDGKFNNNEVYQSLNNQKTESGHISFGIEKKLWDRYQKELNREGWMDWRMGLFGMGFGMFWLSWIVCQKVYINNQGRAVHKIQFFQTQTTMKIVPLISR